MSLLATLCRPLRSLVAAKPALPVLSQRGMATYKHKKYIKWAKGYVGRANRCFKIAKNRVEKAWRLQYIGRKRRKRSARKLWITRINAGGRQYGVPYNRLIAGLNSANIDLNRKVLADMAMTEPLSFRSVIEVTCAVDPYLSQHSREPKPLTDEHVDALANWDWEAEVAASGLDEEGEWVDSVPIIDDEED